VGVVVVVVVVVVAAAAAAAASTEGRPKTQKVSKFFYCWYTSSFRHFSELALHLPLVLVH
jgi:mevalonate pyrophosphate decarboxylase